MIFTNVITLHGSFVYVYLYNCRLLIVPYYVIFFEFSHNYIVFMFVLFYYFIVTGRN